MIANLRTTADAEFDQASQDLLAPGGPFEMGVVHLRGADVRYFLHAPATLRDFWLASQVHGDRPYLVFGEERLTYDDAHAAVAAVCNWLVDQGVCRGDRVAIAMRNYPEWMLIYWACVSIGAVVAGLNAWWTADELGYALKDCGPKVAFCDAERLKRIWTTRGAQSAIRIVGVRTEAVEGVVPWADVLARGGEVPAAEIGPDDDACLFYTSGTTGRSKGARLTHQGCIGSLWNVLFGFQAQARALSLKGVAPQAPPSNAPAALVTTPLFHVTANNGVAYLATATGGALVLMYRWDPAEALRLIERERITAFLGAPVMTRELFDHPDFATRDCSSLTMIGGGGASLPPDLVGEIGRAARYASPTTGYGLTETCGNVSSISGPFYLEAPSSVGRISPLFDYRCVDEDGENVPPGAPGELWLRSSTVIKGYWNAPEATKEAIRDGWLLTGDIARVDDQGRLFIVDRKKDMVLRGGENVYCAEVEACLYAQGSVLECVVFGVADARLGEEVAAVVRLREGASTSPANLTRHCADRIARFKVPRHLWIVEDPLPRNAAGKFDKGAVRARFETALPQV